MYRHRTRKPYESEKKEAESRSRRKTKSSNITNQKVWKLITERKKMFAEAREWLPTDAFGQKVRKPNFNHRKI